MDQQQQIKDRAHALWEEQGRPEGRDLEHWLQAQAELSADIETPPPSPDGLPTPDAVSAISLDPVDQHEPTPLEPESDPLELAPTSFEPESIPSQVEPATLEPTPSPNRARKPRKTKASA